jgi:reactive intermediate/imine deaminase
MVILLGSLLDPGAMLIQPWKPLCQEGDIHPEKVGAPERPYDVGHSRPRIATMPRKTIHTPEAPKAIGPYSQAVAAGGMVFLSGQVGLDPKTGELVAGGLEQEARRAFANLAAVAEAAGPGLAAAARVTIFLTDLSQFAVANRIMQEFFTEPYPARVTIGVAALPRGAAIEVDCILAP